MSRIRVALVTLAVATALGCGRGERNRRLSRQEPEADFTFSANGNSPAGARPDDELMSLAQRQAKPPRHDGACHSTPCNTLAQIAIYVSSCA